MTLVIEYFDDAHWLGGSVYVENLLASLWDLPESQRPHVRVQILGRPDTAMAGRLLAHPLAVTGSARGNGWIAAAARLAHRALVRRLPALAALSRAPGDEIYFPAFDTTQPWRRNLYWIPDFQHRHLPALFEPAEIAWRDTCHARIAASDGVLVLSSQAALADFLSFHPEARVRPRVWSFCSTVRLEAAAQVAAVKRRHGLPERYLYVANQFWRHKDHATVFEAARLLAGRGVDAPVVCTGLTEDRRDPSYFPDLRRALARDGLENRVRLLGVLPREEQLAVFRSACAVVQPSRFEGWSVVVEDAKAIGRPVFASDIAVHREQLAGVPNAVLFRTGDAAHLAECLAAAWSTLGPGPDEASEARAAQATAARRREAARRFAAIVGEALALPRDRSPA